MPLYDYKCDSCGKVDEIMCKAEDPKERPCPHCTGTQHREIGTVKSVQMKGVDPYTHSR